MQPQPDLDFKRITAAIEFIKENFKAQPSLTEIANNIHVSPAHFQRMFTEWAGTSPKKFLQYISIEHAKHLMNEKQATLFDVAYETGLSSSSRLHDLFIKIEGMTPGEYKSGCRNLSINYSFSSSPFGNIIIASTAKGICYMSFVDEEDTGFAALQSRFPHAFFSHQADSLQENAKIIFEQDWSQLKTVKLHLRGTEFQIKVWEALLKIPMGNLLSYGKIAEKIGSPSAARAVGTAIGSNPVAYLIPCHRVIQSSGAIGGYMWGSTRKSAMIGWEAVKSIVQKDINF